MTFARVPILQIDLAHASLDLPDEEYVITYAFIDIENIELIYKLYDSNEERDLYRICFIDRPLSEGVVVARPHVISEKEFIKRLGIKEFIDLTK